MNSTPKTTGLAWHYTPVKNLAAIQETGILRARDHDTFTVLGAHTKDKPHLWFTMNDFWEPSISCMHILRDLPAGDDKNERIAAAMAYAGGTWVRFGYPASLLWPVGITFSAPQPADWRTLIDDWRVSFKDIPIADCSAIDMANIRLEWKRAWTPDPSRLRLLH
jgi:hypothetical protein